MSGETFSIIVWYWQDPQTGASHLRVVRADTAEEVHLRDGAFLLRISTDEHSQVARCFIRHIASGREAYIQSGPNLRAFVKDCLLHSVKSEPTAPEAPEG
jgi:hypothetical protein